MLTERVVFHNLTPAEFPAIYTELTSDPSVADNTLSKVLNLTPGLAKDLRIFGFIMDTRGNLTDFGK